MSHQLAEGVEITGPISPSFQEILTKEALSFVAELHHRFNNKRLTLLDARVDQQVRLNKGERPDFLSETAHVRADNSWVVAQTPPDIQKRHVEITGPTDRKMVINALNCGADVFMADFEDANSPTWNNMVDGQINLRDAVNEDLKFETPEGKRYELKKEHAVLFVRPRGWHLNEKHVLVDGEEISGSLFDFGLYFFHNAKSLIQKGSGPYFYLPKLESHLEARLWNDVFVFAQEQLGIPHGTIRATVLIETILAAFEMEEILYELRHHSAGLNAGRWDYIFSVIKKFRQQNFTLPDRSQVTMTVPFMRAYTENLVKTCHKRAAHAMGGMAAFIPNRKDPAVTEAALKNVREDKERECQDGFDGTWIAHPDLLPVAREVFDQLNRPNQKDRLRDNVHVTAADLLNFEIPGGTITEEGIRLNINVGLQYCASWLRGTGAAAINNLMEDAATAEISRAQLWQWLHQKEVTEESLHKLTDEEMDKIKSLYGTHFDPKIFTQARELFEKLIFSEKFHKFLTLLAYKELP